MATVDSVADEILRRHGTMTARKLQKLVYYTNAVHLTRTGRPIFSEPILAYRYGPVVHSLFKRFQGDWSVSPKSDPSANIAKLSPTATDAIQRALELYGDRSPDWLVKQTHLEKPYTDAWARRRQSDIISSQAIREFYANAFDDTMVDDAIASIAEGKVDGMTADEFRKHYIDQS